MAVMALSWHGTVSGKTQQDAVLHGPKVPRLLPVRLSIASGQGLVVIRFIVHASAAARRALKKLLGGYRQVQSIIASLNNANWDFTP
ncbi:hypothetical protein [Caballeronia sp. LjRoot31]|jgi:hypothetical protein|uniref:hypothetical protein n=1 Tax=Caballeronia sp. LjRoot31 TaxID=3342324 RepID=UPI003F4F5E9D